MRENCGIRPAVFAASLVILGPIGCAGTNLLKWRGDEIPTADENNPVVKIVSIWEPAEGHGLDGLPTRGFAGQIMFFTNAHPSPVRVDGDVRVYLFDDRGTPEEQAKPIHQFDFLGDAWTVHLQQSTLGIGYRVFIPYSRRHPYLVNCGLRIRVIPEAGPAVFSNTVNVTLPGATPNDDLTKTNTNQLMLDKRSNDKPAGQLQASLNRKRISRGDDSFEANSPVSISSAHLQPDQTGKNDKVEIVADTPPKILPAQKNRSQPFSNVSAEDISQAKRRRIEQILQELGQQPPQSSQPTGLETSRHRRRRFRLAPADLDHDSKPSIITRSDRFWNSGGDQSARPADD